MPVLELKDHKDRLAAYRALARGESDTIPFEQGATFERTGAHSVQINMGDGYFLSLSAQDNGELVVTDEVKSIKHAFHFNSKREIAKEVIETRADGPLGRSQDTTIRDYQNEILVLENITEMEVHTDENSIVHNKNQTSRRQFDPVTGQFLSQNDQSNYSIVNSASGITTSQAYNRILLANKDGSYDERTTRTDTLQDSILSYQSHRIFSGPWQESLHHRQIMQSTTWDMRTIYHDGRQTIQRGKSARNQESLYETTHEIEKQTSGNVIKIQSEFKSKDDIVSRVGTYPTFAYSNFEGEKTTIHENGKLIKQQEFKNGKWVDVENGRAGVAAPTAELLAQNAADITAGLDLSVMTIADFIPPKPLSPLKPVA